MHYFSRSQHKRLSWSRLQLRELASEVFAFVDFFGTYLWQVPPLLSDRRCNGGSLGFARPINCQCCGNCIINSPNALYTINKHGHKLVVGEVRQVSEAIYNCSICGEYESPFVVTRGKLVAVDGLAPTIDLLNQPFTIIIEQAPIYHVIC
jgi:hypothetical protein